ncbi:MAG TPA: hypothetical protein VKZ63_11885 [Kofleriaceae bacterium]|nr:hypothetical protein [Kofleriaceae bacterium]
MTPTGPLSHVHGTLLVVRPPVPATVNKAGANYKSEVAHLEYSPRRAYDEWLSICEGILAFGGDALFELEEVDEPLLDRGDLEVDPDGAIRPLGSREVLGRMDDVHTGRVFTANGPWVVVDGDTLRAAMPRMLPHRRDEASYYRDLLQRIAELGGYRLDLRDAPDRWEGMADVAVVGDKVVLTYTVAGHYDAGLSPKSPRSSREGVSFAADVAGVPESARVYAELVYPHFHGDTVHFAARPASGGAPVLVHYPGGLWQDGSRRVSEALGAERVLEIGRDDAVEQYAGNSRQVASGVLVPDGVSAAFTGALEGLGLSVRRVPLYELFGKAGGGPACATLYLPDNLQLPEDAPIRFSRRRDEALARRARLPERLLVAPGFFAGKARG